MRGEKVKISTKGRYGLRAMIDIAINSTQRPVSIKDVASREEISERYLEQLVVLLKKKGLLKSQRGAKGGYRLAKAATEISVGDILRALEGDLNPVDCKLFMEEGCELEEDCLMSLIWSNIREAINKAVDEMILSELIKWSDGDIKRCGI